MEKLIRLFGRSIRFTYHCFDRIVIRGYLSTLSRPENIVYFFRTIKQVDCISKEILRQRTDQYLSWVNAYTHNREIPLIWAQKDVRKKDDLAPMLDAEGVGFRMKENAFVSVADPAALQAAADRIDPRLLKERFRQAVRERQYVPAYRNVLKQPEGLPPKESTGASARGGGEASGGQ